MVYRVSDAQNLSVPRVSFGRHIPGWARLLRVWHNEGFSRDYCGSDLLQFFHCAVYKSSVRKPSAYLLGERLFGSLTESLRGLRAKRTDLLFAHSDPSPFPSCLYNNSYCFSTTTQLTLLHSLSPKAIAIPLAGIAGRFVNKVTPKPNQQHQQQCTSKADSMLASCSRRGNESVGGPCSRYEVQAEVGCSRNHR